MKVSFLITTLQIVDVDRLRLQYKGDGINYPITDYPPEVLKQLMHLLDLLEEGNYLSAYRHYSDFMSKEAQNAVVCEITELFTKIFYAPHVQGVKVEGAKAPVW
jgi:hypothetical protein